MTTEDICENPVCNETHDEFLCEDCGGYFCGNCYALEAPSEEKCSKCCEKVYQEEELAITIDVNGTHVCTLSGVEAAAKPKAKRLVWEDNTAETKSNIFHVGKWHNDYFLKFDGFYSCQYMSVDEAKQAAQLWYDNYVSEFIKENTA